MYQPVNKEINPENQASEILHALALINRIGQNQYTDLRNSQAKKYASDIVDCLAANGLFYADLFEQLEEIYSK